VKQIRKTNENDDNLPSLVSNLLLHSLQVGSKEGSSVWFWLGIGTGFWFLLELLRLSCGTLPGLRLDWAWEECG